MNGSCARMACGSRVVNDAGVKTTNGSFERTDLLRDSCRREIETTRGFGNRSAVDHSDEAFEKARVHISKTYLQKI